MAAHRRAGRELVTVTGPITVDDMGAVRLMTIASLGIGLMPDMAIRGDIEREALVRLLPTYRVPGAALYVVSPPLRHVPQRVTLLRDHLLRELGARLGGSAKAG